MIKNLIFDIGDVLIEYRWMQMFMDHGVSKSETIRIASEMFNSDTWGKRLDAGLINSKQAIEEFRAQYPDDIEIIEWCLTHTELMHVPRPEVWDKIGELKKHGYKIYLLSNYSEELLESHVKGANFLDYVDGGVISFQIKAIKPDPKIYTALLEKYTLKADECLFFDDRKKNVDGAIACGMHSIQVTSRDMLNETLTSIIEGTFQEND